MFGLPGLRPPRSAVTIVAVVFFAAAALLGAIYLWSPHVTIRVTTGPEGGAAQKFIAKFIAYAKAHHPRVDFKLVPVPDLKGSARALENGEADIALVRSDFSPPSNGETLVILRRDVVAIVLPPDSPVDAVGKLAGRTVAIPEGPVQEANAQTLDLILSYYDLPPGSVKHVFLPLARIGEELQHKRAAAVLAVGPIGPGEAVDLVAAVGKAFKGKPSLLAMDEADAIAKRFPGLESIDIPQGGLKARPPIPDDSLTTVAVTYRFVVPMTMLKPVAGLLARSILKAKGLLMQMSPIAEQIEAPDPDAQDPVLPIHPGVADYLSNGDQSFLDDLQQYLYLVGIPLSLAASLIAVLAGVFRGRKLEREQAEVTRLLIIAESAPEAGPEEILALESEFRAIVASCVEKFMAGSAASDQAPVSLAIEHARRSIEARKRALAAAVTSKAG